MKKDSGIFFKWLPIAVTIVAMVVFAYTSLQFTIRSSANSPQSSLVQQSANLLNAGNDLNTVAAGFPRLLLGTSLSPFIIITDSVGKTILSSASLDGNIPNIPVGVFSHVKEGGSHSVTWQPAKGIRNAIVIRGYSFSGTNGFVVVGRSLAEAEYQTGWLLKYSLFALIASLLASFVAVAISLRMERE